MLCGALASAGRFCLLTFSILGEDAAEAGRRRGTGLLNHVRVLLKPSSDLSPPGSIHQIRTAAHGDEPVLFIRVAGAARGVSCQSLTESNRDVTKMIHYFHL